MWARDGTVSGRLLPVLLAGLADLVLPGACAGCGGCAGPAGADGLLCERCRAGLRGCRHPGGAVPWAPSPPPPGMPSCWAAGRTEGVLRRLVTAYKDDGRRDLRPVLAPLLTAAATGALTGDPRVRELVEAGAPVLLVPVPGSRRSRRRRGDVPVAALVRAAAGGLPGEARFAPAVRLVRRTADQAGLGARERRDNVGGAMALARHGAAAVDGAVCVVADDVVTTGATLAETARVLREAGAARVTGAVVAGTSRKPPL
ncbi:MAG TPA: phosphoribosyltransferase family protein [Dermatophilaceae bacterium]|nr:phosphoribosyltransferase family protein [Dermatophilaceae bacterium]